MPPISASRSAPLISCTSPAARSASSHARRSCFDTADAFFGGAFRTRDVGNGHLDSSSLAGSMQFSPRPEGSGAKSGAVVRILLRVVARKDARTPLRGLVAPAVQDLLQALGRDRQLRHGTRHSNGVIDGGSNRRTNPGDTALPAPLIPSGLSGLV